MRFDHEPPGMIAASLAKSLKLGLFVAVLIDCEFE